MNGLFFLSLDFEGMWGAIGGLSDSGVTAFKDRVRQNDTIVPSLLKLFSKYDIHATWAVVGAMMCKDGDEVFSLMDRDVRYDNWNISFKELAGSIKEPELYFFEELVQTVSNTPNQEIATHTFSHYYANEPGTNDELLEQEIKLAQKKSQEVCGKEVVTLIMPRNQIEGVNQELLGKYGVQALRGRADYNNYGHGKIRKVINFLDCYLPLVPRTYKRPDNKERPINLKASVFFRTYFKRLAILEPLKIARIKFEMTKAARRGECFHLWFHPHNMGTNLHVNLKALEKIFIHYQRLNKQYGFESITMSEYAQ